MHECDRQPEGLHLKAAHHLHEGRLHLGAPHPHRFQVVQQRSTEGIPHLQGSAMQACLLAHQHQHLNRYLSCPSLILHRYPLDQVGSRNPLAPASPKSRYYPIMSQSFWHLLQVLGVVRTASISSSLFTTVSISASSESSLCNSSATAR